MATENPASTGDALNTFLTRAKFAGGLQQGVMLGCLKIDDTHILGREKTTIRNDRKASF